MVNFKLGETNVKMKQSACHERGTKPKKYESPIGFFLVADSSKKAREFRSRDQTGPKIVK